MKLVSCFDLPGSSRGTAYARATIRCPECDKLWLKANERSSHMCKRACQHLRFTLVFDISGLWDGHTLKIHGKWNSAVFRSSIRRAFSNHVADWVRQLERIECSEVDQAVIYVRRLAIGCCGALDDTEVYAFGFRRAKAIQE